MEFKTPADEGIRGYISSLIFLRESKSVDLVHSLRGSYLRGT
jgi:hypothetical protein